MLYFKHLPHWYVFEREVFPMTENMETLIRANFRFGRM